MFHLRPPKITQLYNNIRAYSRPHNIPENKRQLIAKKRGHVEKRQQTDTQNGLFRNTVIADIQPGSADQTKPSEQPESAESDQLEAHDSQATETAAETPETPTTDNEENPDEIETGKLAVPFGPFIGLAAIEYAFFGQFVLPLMTNGLLSPWGMMH